MRGRLYILSAPSGTGKTTLCNRLLHATPRLVRSVSVTTRPPRRGEADGKDYLFISPEAFRRLKRTGGLLEWTKYAHAFYGTPLSPLKRFLADGKDVILLLDVRGAREVKKHFKEATTIFLLPPSFEDLKKRLSRRRTEKGVEIEKRLRLAKREMTQVDWYDYVIVNDDLRQAVRALKRIIRKSG
ncbi:MAG: guanylate kinase [Candidatus Omnitrophica bacterium]|nr:guanylate kinase [Candidatus Omnitrophota bacterium]